MLKLKAAFAKKIPAETEYSSQSYHCEIECEIPDGLTQQQLDAKVHGVFDFVRASVEKELSNTASTATVPAPQPQPVHTQPATPRLQTNGSAQPSSAPIRQSGYQEPRRYNRSAASDAPASPKQINFLLSLARRSGWSVEQILSDCGIATIDQMPKRTCSQLIERLSQAA